MPSRRWTEADIKADASLNARAFNDEYNARRGALNGGLDRTSTPPGWVTKARMASGALHLVAISPSAIELPSAYQDSGGTSETFDCLTYNVYAGGWFTLHTETLTGLKAGVMHAEFSCFAWMQNLYTGQSPKGCSFRLRWAGVVVAEVGPLFQSYCNPFLCADFPVTGDGDLVVECAFSPPTGGVDEPDDAQFFVGGGQLLTVGRWR